MSGIDTDAIRRLMERLRSEDEHETEQAIGHLLDQADAGVFERAADEIDRLRARMAELESAIRSVQREHRKMPLARGCDICAPQDEGWPCLTRKELDAVLPPEEEQR